MAPDRHLPFEPERDVERDRRRARRSARRSAFFEISAAPGGTHVLDVDIDVVDPRLRGEVVEERLADVLTVAVSDASGSRRTSPFTIWTSLGEAVVRERGLDLLDGLTGVCGV